MENDDKKYEDVIKVLKGLKEVKAPENFEADLRRKINSEKFPEKKRKNFWENILVPARLIPSLGLVVAAAVIFYVIDTNPEEMDNPFLIEPRIREDIIEVSSYEVYENEQQKELPKAKSLEKDNKVLKRRSDKRELESSRDETLFGRKKTEKNDKLSDDDGLVKNQSITKGSVSISESTFTDVKGSRQLTSSNESSSEIVGGQLINKEELNFRQVQLSSEEQKVVNDLKMQVQSLEKADKNQK